MIQYIEGNLFLSPAQTLVNTVNTVGVMGKGIALEFKQRYPEVFRLYRKACETRQFTMGRLMLFYEADHWILLFPTKENWRNRSDLSYIEAGLQRFSAVYADKGITSIAFPKLECGNGELEWEDVRPLMERYLKDLPINVYIYLNPLTSVEVPEHKSQTDMQVWLRENAKDLSFNGVEDDVRYNYSIIPYEFTVSGTVWQCTWNEGLQFHSSTADIHISEDDFFELWDEVRSEGVVKTGDDIHRQIVYAMLESLGYLSKVNIVNTKMQQSIAGYQINAGAGRVYSLEGRENDDSGSDREE